MCNLKQLLPCGALTAVSGKWESETGKGRQSVNGVFSSKSSMWETVELKAAGKHRVPKVGC